MANLIVCPGCGFELAEKDVEFAVAKRGYPYFDVTCKPCGKKWEAHHQDWYSSQPRNPFQPLKITPPF